MSLQSEIFAEGMVSILRSRVEAYEKELADKRAACSLEDCEYQLYAGKVSGLKEAINVIEKYA